MGITLPKLPKIRSFLSGANSSASGLASIPRKLKVKKQPIEIVPPPEWVEKIDGYFVSSFMWHESGRFGGCFVVKYVPYDDCSASRNWDWGFVKIYASDDMNGMPFVQMKGIWKEIHDCERTYDITEDGRIYNGFGGFPSDDDIRDAIYDIGSMYHDWRDFPNAQDWDTVDRLHEAKNAVDRMRVEAKYGCGQKNIDNLRKKITEIQTQIADAEKDLNEMYEKAAEGMNLLEQYGIVVNLDDEPKESENVVVDYDISSLYPHDSLRFVGEANIVRLAHGSYNVIPKPLNQHPNSGDMVHDPGNGLTALYTDTGKWEVLNP